MYNPFPNSSLIRLGSGSGDPMNVGLKRRPSKARLHFLIVNCFTGINLLLGLVAVIAAASGSLELAAALVLLSTVFDGCDGPLARRWQVASAFGAHFDSLADMTSFIVAGGALAYFWLDPAETSLPSLIVVAVSSAYVLAGAIRLARFNTIPPQTGYFQGMPTTVTAAIVASNLLIHPALADKWIVGLILLLSVLMVSVFPYPKLSSLMPRFPNWCFPLVLLGALVNLPWTLGVATSLYVCSGPLITARRRYAAGRAD